MDDNNLLLNFDQYRADVQSMIDSYVTSIDDLSTNASTSSECEKCSHHFEPNSSSPSSLIMIDRDPALSEHLTDEIRWLLIQYGPHQPRHNKDIFLASAKSTNNGKGTAYFREKWFDDIRFANWLEYSLSTCRAYCLYCRLFVDSNRNRAFSRDGY